MTNGQLRVVTDGTIDLSPTSDLTAEMIQQWSVTYVPCRFQVGGRIYESSDPFALQGLAKQAGGAAGATLLPPAFNMFVHVYRQLAPSPVLSVHASSELGLIARSAHLARNLLTAGHVGGMYEAGAFRPLSLTFERSPRREIVVFDCKSIDLGIKFLTLVAAQAAREGYSAAQVALLLSRLQDEMMRTFLVAPDLSRLRQFPCEIPPTLQGQHLKGEGLLSVDRRRGIFVLENHMPGVSQYLWDPNGPARDIPRPCELWVRYSGFEQEVNYLYYQAATLFQAEKVYLHTDEPGVAPYFNGPYLEVVFCPTAAAVERVKRFVKRWEGRGESVS